MSGRNKLRTRYTVYDSNGQRVARLSASHDGHLFGCEGNLKRFTAVPSHMTSQQDLSDVDLVESQTEPLRQSIARLRYPDVLTEAPEDWSFNCPLFRQPCNNLFNSDPEIDVDEFEEDLREYVFDWTEEDIESLINEYINEGHSPQEIVTLLVNNFSDDEMENVQRTQWIFSPRGTNKDADPHIYTSSLAYYAMKNYLPQWALEDIAHNIGLDGHAQIQMYNLIQFERELTQAHSTFEWDSELEFYQYIADKYRDKFTTVELEQVESDVEEAIENNKDMYTELVEEYRNEWVSILGGDMSQRDSTWYNYNQTVSGPEFKSPMCAYAFVYTLQMTFDNVMNTLKEDIENGNKNIVPDEIITRPVSSLDSKDEEVKSVEITNVDPCVYREWWNGDNIPALTMYCPNCGEKVYEDHEDNHIFDYSLQLDCHKCEFILTPYNIITMPVEHAVDTMDESTTEQVLRTYWNRAIRYGFRLSDRIAVNLRAYEFERYAEMLDIDWSLKCPLFRMDIDNMDNENITDVEFNHVRYEDDSGSSIKQMAEGFTLSRCAHDVVHKNLQQYYFDNYIIGNYGEGDELNVDWLEYQVHQVVEAEHVVYQSLEGEVDKYDEKFLSHIQTYYDLDEYDIEWIRTAHEIVEEHLELIQERYNDNIDHYYGWYVDRNEKGLNSKDDVKEFMDAKEERNERYLSELDNRDDIKWRAGDKIGLTHPTVDLYN